jgi:hypothetical protein
LAVVTPVRVRVEFVCAGARGVPFFSHRYVGAGSPMALTLKVAFNPAATQSERGWLVICTATGMSVVSRLAKP